MIFNSFQREDDDAVFTIVRNVAGATVTSGYPVVWDISSSVDGVRVTKPATATLSLFRGVAVETITDSNYGKVQVHGYCAAANVINETVVTRAGGQILIPVDAQWYLKYSAASDGKSGFVYAAATASTATTPSASNAKVLIRAL